MNSIDQSTNSSKYPLLSTIDSPKDLKQLKVDQLPALCAEIRQFIIEHLAVNPGHFASSMGAVDIIVALHYVYDAPNDRLVWDVGHQAYAHKILTGRKKLFHTNRTKDGLSGFPNPLESEYDTFMTGHASNSISAALGMSQAAELEQKDRKVVAIIGDSSISGGLAFEGLNNASNHNNNLLIVLNDNEMSISPNTTSLGKYMNEISTSKKYNTLRYKTYLFLKKHKILSQQGKGIVLRFNNALKSLLTGQQNIFEGLNIRYFGPFDGHDVVRLVKIFSDLKDMKGPKMVHLHTVKGKGYKLAEQDPITWHAPGKFNPNTGERLSSGDHGCLKYQDIFGHTLVELAKKNNKIVGITAAMLGGTSMNIMQQAFPDRTFDVGICEAHAVTFSGGLACDGLVPFCAIYSTFLQRAYDQIINDISIQKLPVIFCLDRGGLVGEDGVTHHGLFDLAYLRLIPNMTVASPIDEHDLRNLMFTAQKRASGPFAIRYPRGNGVHIDWKNEMHELPIGQGRCLANGDKIAVLSIGHIGQNVIQALAMLSDEEKTHVAHYDMIFLKPIDEDILRQASQYDTIVTVEDGTVVGGLGSAVADWLTSNGHSTKLIKMGVYDKFVDHASVAQLQRSCGYDADSIATQLRKLLQP